MVVFSKEIDSDFLYNFGLGRVVTLQIAIREEI